MKSSEGDVGYFEVNAVFNGAAGGEHVNCKIEDNW